MPDTYAGMISATVGGPIAGMISGPMDEQSLRSVAIGGLNRLSGAAPTAAIAERLRGRYQCGCSQ